MIDVGRVPFANLRDLGGLPAGARSQVRPGALLRSELVLPGDSTDNEGWPPALVVDLRSPDEQQSVHPLEGHAEILRIPLLDEAGQERIAAADRTFELTGMYLRALSRFGEVAPEVVGRIVQADGAVLVHCAAGKDRTGVVVAILLAVLGVSWIDIRADYHRTAGNMTAVLERIVRSRPPEQRLRLRTQMEQAPRALFETSANAIDAVLDVLAGTRGGPAAWFAATGVDAATLSELNERLTWRQRRAL